MGLSEVGFFSDRLSSDLSYLESDLGGSSFLSFIVSNGVSVLLSSSRKERDARSKERIDFLSSLSPLVVEFTVMSLDAPKQEVGGVKLL